MPKLFPLNARGDFLDLVCSGASVSAAARRVGASRGTGKKWWAQSGQMTLSMGVVGGLADPPPAADGPGGRTLSATERGMIQMGRLAGMSYAKIGAAIGRDKSVVWREVKRNSGADGEYYASVAHAKAHQARRRPKPFKLIEDEDLCRLIAVWMDDGWSPKLISAMLAFYFPDDQTMQVSHETIYQALYVQTRGKLRADLAAKLSLKRKQRVPHTADRAKSNPYKEAFTISERPAEVQDRAVPGHWESQCFCQAARALILGIGSW
jgi:IS30 family transposase